MALALTFGSLLAIALWEFLRPRRQREFPAFRRRLRNIGIWLFNIIAAGLIFATPGRFRPQGWPAWTFGAVAAFLFLDLLSYAIHRAQHAVPFLWRFHALHHSDPDVDWSTSVRHHPVEYLLATSVYWVAILALGLPLSVVFAHGSAVFTTAVITHGNIRLPEWVERLLQPVVITLDLHLVHHSAAVDEANVNFGAVLSIWDRLFGTYARLPREQVDQLVFGVRELPRSEACRPAAMLLTPWRLSPSQPD